MKIVKYAISSILCNLVRLVRFFPNNDPIMAFMLPFSRQGKWFSSAVFVFATMFLFDFFTSGIGIWTWVTSITYAVLGLGAHFYFKRKAKTGLLDYLGAGIGATLVFDFITGVLFGPTLFGVPIWLAFLGQIPFTLMHILSVSLYIVVLTPVLDKNILQNNALEDASLFTAIKSLLKNKVFSSQN